MKIKVLIKEPGEQLRASEVENTLEALQSVVGGYIETVTVATDLVIICNEEGILKGLPFNCEVLNHGFVGTILFAGAAGDEFADIPPAAETLVRGMIL